LHGVWSSVSQMREDVTFYKTAATTSRDFFNVAMHSTTGLSPDYSEFDGTPTGGQKYFGYDAFRTVMNVAMDYAWWAKDSRQTGLANRLLTFFHGKGVTTYKGLWNVDGTAYSNPGDHSPGLVAMNAAASLVSTYVNTGDFINDFWNISMTSGQYRYYDGCLYMLGMLNVSGNYKVYLSSGAYVQTPSISPATATFDKRVGQQANIVITINNLGNNTLSNIKNGGTTLTSGTNYSVSGSAVTINISYLSTLSVGTVPLTFNFSDGTAKTLSITVIESTEGGGTGGISFDFASASPTVTTNGTITAVVTGGVLAVTKTGGYSTPTFGLTFSLGSKKLGDFNYISVFIKAISGDTTYKTFTAKVGGTSIGSIQTNPSASAFTEYKIPLASSLTQTGDILITFDFGSTNAYEVQIQSIKIE
ncbi:MAG: hypothetical protein FWB86_07310, partial [Treponema sp.]|nr:hypothetical protein [Treponema sp.]MCL2252033.1 hypothetical protein [Treponema sp.]